MTSTSTVDSDDVIDNAAPEIVTVYAENANTVDVTYTEAVTLQGNDRGYRYIILH